MCCDRCGLTYILLEITSIIVVVSVQISVLLLTDCPRLWAGMVWFCSAVFLITHIAGASAEKYRDFHNLACLYYLTLVSTTISWLVHIILLVMVVNEVRWPAKDVGLCSNSQLYTGVIMVYAVFANASLFSLMVKHCIRHRQHNADNPPESYPYYKRQSLSTTPNPPI